MSADKDLVKYLYHAMPYVVSHNNKTFVIVLDSLTFIHPNFLNVIDNINLLHSLNIKLVVVYGARHLINQRLQEMNIPPKYNKNIRITDKQSLEVIQQICGQLQFDILARLSARMLANHDSKKAINVICGNFVIARPIGVEDGIDYLHSGKVRRIDIEGIKRQLEQHSIVLIGPIATSVTGESFNIPYEEIAADLAVSLDADKIVYYTPERGILDEKGNLLKRLRLDKAEQRLAQLLSQQKIDQVYDDQIRFLQTGIHVITHGVERAHLITHQEKDSLLRELFSREGTGTQISLINSEIVRTATLNDIPNLLALIHPLEQQGILVKRSREQLEMNIHQYIVIDLDGSVIACATLHPYLAESMAEVACVVVHPDYQRSSRGDVLLENLEAKAKKLKIKKIFVLTTKTAQWFQIRGFKEATIEQLPAEKRKNYNYSRSSKVLIKDIS